ncbi:MAG TPA: sterol-binding protein [Burkholderiales bacterium]|nr:sterol-binding protein [Burkholderiales bacterium]
MIGRAAAAAVNHVMAREGWPLDRLRPFAGRTALFRLPPFEVALTVTERGQLAEAPAGTAPDASFTLTLPLLARIAAGDPEAHQGVEVAGDSALAEAVFAVSKNLRWDAEEDLSRVVGDIAAHRLAGAGRSFLRWQAQAALGLAQAFSEYWTEERPLIARSGDVVEFVADVDRLRNDAERLEKRLKKLESRQEPRN